MLTGEGFGQAEVADLCIVLGDEQHVAGCQVSVDKVMLLQVLHPHGDLMHKLGDIFNGKPV